MTENIFSPAISALHAGGVIAYPTEAVYGLGCDPHDASAVHHLLDMKKRALDKGLILIAADIAQLMPYIDLTQIPPTRMQEISAQWPGPFTWVFPARSYTPKWVCGAYPTVAVRVTAHPIARQLCAAFGRPLISTSANVTGQLPAKNADAVDALFATQLACIVPGEVGLLEKPTEIRDAMGGGVVRE
jgi:L-threonylcarbamoyladenylate synthase